MVEKKKQSASKKERENEPPDTEPQRVLVEMRLSRGVSPQAAIEAASGLNVNVPALQIDPDYEPVPIGPPADAALAQSLDEAREEIVLVRGTIDADKIADIEAQPNVIKVWRDTDVAPFGAAASEAASEAATEIDVDQFFVQAGDAAAFGDCPIAPCDCDQGTTACSKGSMADVARYLGVDQIRAAGYEGQNITIGIVDGGVTAQGRTIESADLNHPKWPGRLIPRVVDGWPSDWGTTGVAWGWHGNMTATDALGMAPQARIYDIRISGNAISNALSGFQWAINRHKADGTPHILSNSWGIFQESWDSVYARDPDHPFTRKVVEAINEGILVLFAAGNCGERCPSGRCGGAAGDIGPGKSIWGANGLDRVMTVGAANIENHLIGYSSQGPASLHSQKPDFCSISHFTGFFPCDTGTSAACPIAAGAVALMKEAVPTLSQDSAKDALKRTARNIGPAGWDQHSGAGIIQAKAALDHIEPVKPEDRCQPHRVKAARALALYRRTGRRRHLCLYYRYLTAYYRCRYLTTKNRHYLCLYYRHRANYYRCRYLTTKNRHYLCLYYRHRATYYRCRYLLTKNRRYLTLYRKYLARYRSCRTSGTLLVS